MAIAVRGTATTFTTGVAVTTVTNNVPAGVVPGDFLLWRAAGNIVTDPSTPAGGWQVLQSNTTTALRATSFWKIATVGEPASYGLAVASARWVGVMAAYSGVDPSNPFDGAAATVATGTTTLGFNAVNGTRPDNWAYALGSCITTAGGALTFSTSNLDVLDGQTANTAAATAADAGACIGHEVNAANGFVPNMSTSQATTRTIGQAGTLRAAFVAPHVGIINPASTRSATR